MPTLDSITAISPLDGRYHAKLKPLAPIVSEYGLIRYRFITELQWLITLIRHDIIELSSSHKTQAITKIQSYQSSFSEATAHAVKHHEQTTAHDIKALEYTIADHFRNDPDLTPLIPWIHFACTSADINNTAYAMMLDDVLNNICIPQGKQLRATLQTLIDDTLTAAMLSHTHGQPASPTTMGKELQNFQQRLQKLYKRLEQAGVCAKFNGAVGNYNAHQFVYPDTDWQHVSQQFIESLGLNWQSHSTQVESSDHLAYIMHTLAELMSVIIDLCRDIWLYISMNYFTQQVQTHEVGSSTMPHKVNPIHFENAEGNAELARTLCNFIADKMPISRLQRDLSGSTVMRNLGSCIGYIQLSLTSLVSGLARLSANKVFMQQQLEHAYELLAEPIQTMMRRYGIADAYEQLKALTRGQRRVDLATYQQLIGSLPIPAHAKQRLAELTPATYLGLAVDLAEKPDID